MNTIRKTVTSTLINKTINKQREAKLGLGWLEGGKGDILNKGRPETLLPHQYPSLFLHQCFPNRCQWPWANKTDQSDCFEELAWRNKCGRQVFEQIALGKADSTLRSSQAVPHPSTNRALCRLTSEVERDPVHSTRYGRQRINKKVNTTASLGLWWYGQLTSEASVLVQKRLPQGWELDALPTRLGGLVFQFDFAVLYWCAA